MPEPEQWVLFERDILRAPDNTFDSKLDMIRFLALDQFPNGAIYWVDSHSSVTLYARDLIKTTFKQLFITTFPYRSNVYFCNFLLRSLGRPLPKYYTEIARLGFWRVAGTVTTLQHPLWEPNLIGLVASFLVA